LHVIETHLNWARLEGGPDARGGSAALWLQQIIHT